MPEFLVGILVFAGSIMIGSCLVYVTRQDFWSGLLLAVIAGVTPIIITYKISEVKGPEMAITFILIYGIGIIIGGVLQLKGWLK